MIGLIASAVNHPNVKAKAATPGSRNSISNADRRWARLTDQLIQPLLADRAIALVVDIGSVSGTRRLAIDQHAKPHGRSRRGRSHDEVKIAGVKAVRDPPVGLVQHGRLSPDRPIP